MASTKIISVNRGVSHDRLTDKQQIFVAEYLADDQMNGLRAAKMAGYKSPASTAARLLVDPLVSRAIGKALKKREERCELTSDDVLKQLAAALYLDPIDLFEEVEDGVLKLKKLRDIPAYVRRCITKLKGKCRTTTDKEGNTVTETYIEVDLMSKDAALPLAMRHLGLGGKDTPGGQDVRINLNIVAQLLSETEDARNVINGKLLAAPLPPMPVVEE